VTYCYWLEVIVISNSQQPVEVIMTSFLLEVSFTDFTNSLLHPPYSSWQSPPSNGWRMRVVWARKLQDGCPCPLSLRRIRASRPWYVSSWGEF
jgi:hypothetical protein